MPSLEWDKQVEMIRHCIENRKPLHEALIAKGLSYDDLVYYHKTRANGAGALEKWAVSRLLSVTSLPQNRLKTPSNRSTGGVERGKKRRVK